MKIKTINQNIEKLLTKRISFYKTLNEDQKEELWGLLSDYERYRIQLKNQKKHGQTHLDKKYKLYLFQDLVRVVEDKKLIYGDIYSVHG